jgi:hypothetical protein
MGLRFNVAFLNVLLWFVPNPPTVHCADVSNSVFSPKQRSLRAFSVNSEYRGGRLSHKRSTTDPTSTTLVQLDKTMLSRNFLISVVLLLLVAIGGTLRLRDATPDSTRSRRQCPLASWLGEPANNTTTKLAQSLDDARVDWDRVMISSKYEILFDPSRLKIDSLLATPPPTFRRNVGLAAATLDYLQLMSKVRTPRKYINLSV